MAKEPSPCLHCGEAQTVRRRRGLCRECHEDPAIRAKYPQVLRGKIRESGRGSTADRDDGLAEVPEPTFAYPGSEEKIQILMARVKKRQRVDAKGDAKL